MQQDQENELLTRGVADIIPREELEKKLRATQPMKIYLGVDPTGPDIHIGHAVILRKMREFQKLGHTIILLIGDFTARIGDPTDKDAARVVLTHEQVLENANTYQAQAAKILDFEDKKNPAILDYNSRWLDALNFQDVLELASEFTVQQMLERDMFEKRFYGEVKCGSCENWVSIPIRARVYARNNQNFEEGTLKLERSLAEFPCSKCNKLIDLNLFNEQRFPKPIYVHEFLYPIMQGYDSVAMDIDMEFGGTDQLFNMLAGRTLVKNHNKKEKVVMTFELLEGLDGRKMSKSYGNTVGVMDAPNDMFGKIMSLADELIPRYFELATDVSLDVVAQVRERMKTENPRDLKVELAREIVTMYHSASDAASAEQAFFAQFADKQLPQDIPEYTLTASDSDLPSLLINAGLASSKGEVKRLMEQGGVRVNETKMIDPTLPVEFSNGDIIQVGKRRFIKIVK